MEEITEKIVNQIQIIHPGNMQKKYHLLQNLLLQYHEVLILKDQNNQKDLDP